MSRVLNLLLSHQPPAQVAQTLEWWKQLGPLDDLLLAYGGPIEAFEKISFSHRVFVPDPALRTRDHPLERQSYTAVFRQACAWLADKDYSHVYFAEFDHLPLASDLHHRLFTAMAEEGADVLAHHLKRIDATNDPHYLYECSRPEFHALWERLSCRAERRVVLSMIATGSFWSRAAFEAIAAREEPLRIYLEIYLPTLAHHLGFRIRDLAGQNRFVNVGPDRGGELAKARAAGAWALHPVKTIVPSYFAQLPAKRPSPVAQAAL